MLPSQFKILSKLLSTELQSIRDSVRDQTKAVDDASKASIKNQNEHYHPQPNPLPVTAEVHGTEAEQGDQRSRHNQNLSIQAFLTVGTWLAFVAAAYYAFIAAQQKVTMDKTLKESQKQTYIACLNAQISQKNLIVFQKSAADSHASVLVAIEQAKISIEQGRSIITVSTSIPSSTINYADNLFRIPFSFRNVGHAVAQKFYLDARAVLVSNGERFSLKSLPLDRVASAAIIQAGAGFPGQSTDPRFISDTPNILVSTTSGKLISETSPQVRDFIAAGNQEVVILYGTVQYRDVTGFHKEKFCTTLGLMRQDTQFMRSQSEKECIDYNSKTNGYPTLPDIESQPKETTKMDDIVCVKPPEE